MVVGAAVTLWMGTAEYRVLFDPSCEFVHHLWERSDTPEGTLRSIREAQGIPPRFGLSTGEDYWVNRGLVHTDAAASIRPMRSTAPSNSFTT